MFGFRDNGRSLSAVVECECLLSLIVHCGENWLFVTGPRRHLWLYNACALKVNLNPLAADIKQHKISKKGLPPYGRAVEVTASDPRTRHYTSCSHVQHSICNAILATQASKT